MSRSDGWRLSIPKARISSCSPFGPHSLRRADERDRRTKAIVRYVLTAPVRPRIPSLDQWGGEAAAPFPYHEPPAARASVADPKLRTAGASIVPAGSEIPLLLYASHL